MLIQSLLVAAGLTTALAASAKSNSEATWQKFRDLAKKNSGVVQLTSSTYDELIAGPRDFSVSVLLTAMAPQFKCAPCQVFDVEHAMVAKQWAAQPEHDEHILAVLDFANGQAIFQRLALTSAPTFQLFKPTEGPRATGKTGAETYDFARAGYKAEAIVEYLKGNAGIPINFSRPVDKAKLFSLVGAVVVTITTTVFAWPFLIIVLRQTYIWSVGTIIIILLMTSGYMWNQIRHPQYSQTGNNGQINYIAGGYSNQLGAETHIMACIYGILAFSAYTLAYTIPKLNDPARQRLGVYVWTMISVVMMGVLMNIFSIKQGGYPFRFF